MVSSSRQLSLAITSFNLNARPLLRAAMARSSQPCCLVVDELVVNAVGCHLRLEGRELLALPTPWVPDAGSVMA
jgi:hypothetical protein